MKLNNYSLSQKLVVSLFLIGLGGGYLVSLFFLWKSESLEDLEPGLSKQDVIYRYHGGQIPLGFAIEGSMKEHIEDKEERDLIHKWIADGTPEESWRPVWRVIRNRCLDCHTEGGDASGQSFDEGYEAVKLFTEPKGPMATHELARLSHIHAVPMMLMCLAVGWLIALTRLREPLKILLILLPFVGTVLDIGGWWLTAQSPSYAILVMLGGGLFGLGLAIGIVVCLLSMWRKADPVAPDHAN